MTEKCGSTDTTTGDPCQNDKDSCPWHDVDEQPETGRPTKLSYERQEQIAGAIEQGKSLNSAARMAGVDPSTVYGWIDRGESEIKAGNENEFTEFYKRLTRAKGQGEDFYFNLALQLAKENEDHRFIASLMKQRYPDSWGDTETGVDSDSVTIEITEDVKESWPELE
jgi:transposase-like protein